ncbi:MAG: adenosylmethionine-8-amino-7-oxononanoate aminotransferase [Gammaproteobacteria bacterium]|jgi:adenosylmethionine-8-amino-7-oxononanoate aminotransferase
MRQHYASPVCSSPLARVYPVKSVTPLFEIAEIDDKHIWHPYSAMHSDSSIYTVESASGVRLKLFNGKELIDGMSSWWCALHGYNHPRLNKALIDQSQLMSHVMFGGLTHKPAVELVKRLLKIVPQGLSSVFLSDSGSVSVEVAMKMAIQYWNASNLPAKQQFMTIRNGYHGDTFGAMSVCDPVTGMHGLFSEALKQQHFVPSPSCRFGGSANSSDLEAVESTLKSKASSIAAFILEPIVQGAGGMKIYSASYLSEVRRLCDQYEVLLIVDEIATGFGRTGKMFASHHAEITPDIMCIGKAMTGGYMTLAATLTTPEISNKIDGADPGVFMHGPTFMGNPLACAVASASIDLLMNQDWELRVQSISNRLLAGLSPCLNHASVVDVRVLGAIGVVELKTPVDMEKITQFFVAQGVWIRPFGRLVYLMPPYIINDDDLDTLCLVIVKAIEQA